MRQTAHERPAEIEPGQPACEHTEPREARGDRHEWTADREALHALGARRAPSRPRLQRAQPARPQQPPAEDRQRCGHERQGDGEADEHGDGQSRTERAQEPQLRDEEREAAGGHGHAARDEDRRQLARGDLGRGRSAQSCPEVASQARHEEQDVVGDHAEEQRDDDRCYLPRDRDVDDPPRRGHHPHGQQVGDRDRCQCDEGRDDRTHVEPDGDGHEHDGRQLQQAQVVGDHVALLVVGGDRPRDPDVCARRRAGRDALTCEALGRPRARAPAGVRPVDERHERCGAALARERTGSDRVGQQVRAERTDVVELSAIDGEDLRSDRGEPRGRHPARIALDDPGAADQREGEELRRAHLGVHGLRTRGDEAPEPTLVRLLDPGQEERCGDDDRDPADDDRVAQADDRRGQPCAHRARIPARWAATAAGRRSLAARDCSAHGRPSASRSRR